jgi:hypothetical protein
VIKVRAPVYFINTSITTPAVSALKNFHIQGFLEAPADILNRFWIKVAVSILKSPHGGFRSKNRYVTVLEGKWLNIHSGYV